MNYSKIKKHCEVGTAISSSLLDNYLIPYAGKYEQLEALFARKLALFKDVVNKMQDGWIYWVLSQYIAYELLKKNGFVKNYLRQNVLKGRTSEEMEWLVAQTEFPWRFSFFSVKENPAPNFFNMYDELAGEEILLYSPGIQDILEKRNVQMFFVLVGFNGQCWQTFGPNAYFVGIRPFDLLYFSRHIDPGIVFMNSISALIDKDPLPFMLLLKSAEIPLTMHKDDPTIINKSDYLETNFIPENFSQHFTITKKYPVYKMELSGWDMPPHFSTCYYHAKKKRLILSSMTDRGYTRIVEALAQSGYSAPAHPEWRATMAMVLIAKDIFKTKDDLVPYEKTFREPVSPESQKELDKINIFLKSYLEYHNAGKPYDLHALAAKAGIDDVQARDLIDHVSKTSDRLRLKK